MYSGIHLNLSMQQLKLLLKTHGNSSQCFYHELLAHVYSLDSLLAAYTQTNSTPILQQSLFRHQCINHIQSCKNVRDAVLTISLHLFSNKGAATNWVLIFKACLHVQPVKVYSIKINSSYYFKGPGLPVVASDCQWLPVVASGYQWLPLVTDAQCNIDRIRCP